MEDEMQMQMMRSELEELRSRLSMLEADAEEAKQMAGGQMAAVPIPQIGGDDAIPRPFDIEDGKVVRCTAYLANQTTGCNDYTIDTEGGDIWLHVSRGASSYSISINQTFVAETATSVSIRLYVYADGQVKRDDRPGIIPVLAL